MKALKKEHCMRVIRIPSACRIDRFCDAANVILGGQCHFPRLALLYCTGVMLLHLSLLLTRGNFGLTVQPPNLVRQHELAVGVRVRHIVRVRAIVIPSSPQNTTDSNRSFAVILSTSLRIVIVIVGHSQISLNLPNSWTKSIRTYLIVNFSYISPNDYW